MKGYVAARDARRGRGEAPRWDNSKTGAERVSRMMEHCPAHITDQIVATATIPGLVEYEVPDAHRKQVKRELKRLGIANVEAPYANGTTRFLASADAPSQLKHATQLRRVYNLDLAVGMATDWLRHHDWTSGKNRRLKGSKGVTIHPKNEPSHVLIGDCSAETADEFTAAANRAADLAGVKVWVKVDYTDEDREQLAFHVYAADGTTLTDTQKLVMFYAYLYDNWLDSDKLRSVIDLMEQDGLGLVRRRSRFLPAA